MLLGQRTLAMGDIRRYTVDYRDWLEEGNHIVTTAVTVPAGTASSVGSITYEENKHSLHFFINAGAVNENFTATIQVTDNEGQVVNDTIQFTVTNP